MRKSSVIAFTRKKPAVFLFFPAVITMVFFKITGLLSSVSFFRNSLLLAAGVLTAHSFQGTKRTANSKTVNDREQTGNERKETVDGSTGTAGEIFFCIDLNDWRFSYINPAAEEALGYPARICTTIPGFIFKFLDPGSTRVLKAAVNRFHHSSEKICTLELKWRKADHRDLLLEVTLIPIRDNGGRPVSIEAIGRNVTRCKQRENRLSYLYNAG